MLNNDKKATYKSLYPIYLKFKSRQNSSLATEVRIMPWRPWWGGGRKDPAGVLEMFYIDLGGGDPGVYVNKSFTSCKPKTCAFHGMFVIP